MYVLCNSVSLPSCGATNEALETGLWPSSVGGMQLVKFSFLAFVSNYLMRLKLQITISVKSTLNLVTNQRAECQLSFQFGIKVGRTNAKRLLQTRNCQVRLFTFQIYKLKFLDWSNYSRDSVVGIATAYGLDDRGVGVRVSVGSGIFSSPQRPDRLGAHPAP
jgi:hypothetical protein